MIRLLCFTKILLLALNLSVVTAQSPYKLDLKQETVIFGTGLAFELFAIHLFRNMPDLSLDEIEKLSAEDINPFDRGTTKNWSPGASKLSDYLLKASYVWPVFLAFSGKIRSDAFEIATLYAQTGLYTSFPTVATKSITQRIRPFVYNEEVPLDYKTKKIANRSFYSGHTVTAFSAAAFTSKIFSDYYPKSDYRALVWGVSLLHAGTVGYLRHAAGKHFPTDIITGAIIGTFIGFIIPEIHKHEQKLRGEPQPDIAFSFSFQL